jgi:hypothetical protein
MMSWNQIIISISYIKSLGETQDGISLPILIFQQTIFAFKRLIQNENRLLEISL